MRPPTRIFSLLVLLAAACAPPLIPVHLPPGIRSIAVLPPRNLTGDDLLVSGTSLLERYVLHSERVTVGDVLEWEADRQLAAMGWTVADPAAVDTAVPAPPASAAEAAAIVTRSGLADSALFIAIRRCEADAAFQPSTVIVALDLTLVDAAGHTLWQRTYPARPVATPGAVTRGDAYVIAVRQVLKAVLAPLATA